jgi:hypothetical protein
MPKQTQKNYTDEQEAVLAKYTMIDNAIALELASQFNKDVKSIRAKAVRLGIYKRQEKVTKSGTKIEQKSAIVSEIATIAGIAIEALDGLDKAPKTALQAIRQAIAA